jgi:Glycosyl hydrolase family 26
MPVTFSRREFLAGCAVLAVGGLVAVGLRDDSEEATPSRAVAFGQTSLAGQPPVFDRGQFLADQSALGRPIRLTHTLYNFNDDPGADEQWLLSRGVTPIVNCFGRLNGSDYPGNGPIAAGDHDAQIVRWADALGSLAGTVLLRPLREMNRSFTPWYTSSHSEFIAAWHHIHDLFSRASNVSFVWCPATSGAPYEPWYPGDQYVDICGVDGYSREDNWLSFRDLFAPFYSLCNPKDGTLARKPTMVCETNAEVATDQAAFDRGAFFAGIVPALKESFPLMSGLCVWIDGNYPDVGVAGSEQYLTMAKDGYLSATL